MQDKIDFILTMRQTALLCFLSECIFKHITQYSYIYSITWYKTITLFFFYKNDGYLQLFTSTTTSK